MKVAVKGTGAYYERGIAYLQEFGYTIADSANVLVCLAHPKILTAAQIAEYPKGCINFHCGLPNYRGRHPLQWMLIDGVRRIPCAVHYMDEGIDTGDIISESSFEVDRNETYATALEKVLKLVGPLLIEALYKIEHDQVRRKVQEIGRYWPRRTAADSSFSFDQPSATVHRFVNAMADGGMPNAFCGDMKFKRSHIGEKPGRILDTTTDGRYVVATRDGVVLLERA